MRTEEEVDKMIKEMIGKNGKYITQGIAFNKNSKSQMELLKFALMSSYSFGAFIKELISEKMNGNVSSIENNFKQFENIQNIPPTPPPIVENNFKEFESSNNDNDSRINMFI